MKTIWKYQLEVTDEQVLQVPHGSEVLCVQIQDDTPCLWIKVPDDRENGWRERLTILTFDTGNPLSEEGDYIGAYQTKGLVFHVFTKE